MSEILRIAANVGTPLALLGLVAALAYFVYTRRLKYEKEKLEALPPDERATRTDEYLTRYGIDGKNLRIEDKVALIREEMEKRHKRSFAYVIIAAVVFTVCFGLAVLAFVLRQSQANPQPQPNDNNAGNAGHIDGPASEATRTTNERVINHLLNDLTASVNASIEKDKQLASLKAQVGEKGYRVVELENELAKMKRTIQIQLKKSEEALKGQQLNPDQSQRINNAREAVQRLTHLTSDFRGVSRKASKTTASSKPLETFPNLAKLVATLPDDSVMKQKRIKPYPNSMRVVEEDRNVSVPVFLYAAVKMYNNDYYLILGDSPKQKDRVYLAGAISGLPVNGPFREILQQTRTQFENYFGESLPAKSHPTRRDESRVIYTVYNPPISVKVTGSLYYGVDFPVEEAGVGEMRAKSNWEIHPITDIVFGESVWSD
jgi:hypothetical protein